MPVRRLQIDGDAIRRMVGLAGLHEQHQMWRTAALQARADDLANQQAISWQSLSWKSLRRHVRSPEKVSGQRALHGGTAFWIIPEASRLWRTRQSQLRAPRRSGRR